MSMHMHTCPCVIVYTAMCMYVACVCLHICACISFSRTLNSADIHFSSFFLEFSRQVAQHFRPSVQWGICEKVPEPEGSQNQSIWLAKVQPKLGPAPGSSKVPDPFSHIPWLGWGHLLPSILQSCITLALHILPSHFKGPWSQPWAHRDYPAHLAILKSTD